MTFFIFYVLFAFVTFTSAGTHQNVRRDEIDLIPSVARTSPELSSESSAARIKPHADKINEFYRLYGWLKPNQTVPDSELPKAVKKIQKVLNEPVTGVVGANLTEILSRPRCGTEQPYNETAANSPDGLHKRFVVWGPKWQQTTLTWRFVNYTDQTSRTQQQSIISNAFAQWMNYTPLNLVQASSTAKTSDIYIQFNHFGRDDTRYASTSMVSDGTVMRSGAIGVTFNQDYNWNDERLFTFTAVHEIGHALGLSHSAVESAIMFAYYGGLFRPIHPDDKMGIHSIYGFKNPKWSRIDASSPRSIFQITTPSEVTWTPGKNDGLYKLQASSGQISRYTGSSWAAVDANKNTVQLAGSGGRLYQRRDDGSVYRWTGSGTTWDYIGEPSENVIDIVATADQIYSRRKDGWVTRYSGSGQAWLTIEQPQARVSSQIAISDTKTLWILLTNGDIVRSFWPHDTGTWRVVNIDPTNVAIATGGGDRFYKLQSTGRVAWLNIKENYWQDIENVNSVAIYAQGDYVYSKHADGSLWRWTETQYVWEMLDNSLDIANVVGDRSGGIWAQDASGSTYKYIS